MTPRSPHVHGSAPGRLVVGLGPVLAGRVGRVGRQEDEPTPRAPLHPSRNTQPQQPSERNDGLLYLPNLQVPLAAHFTPGANREGDSGNQSSSLTKLAQGTPHDGELTSQVTLKSSVHSHVTSASSRSQTVPLQKAGTPVSTEPP